MAVEAGTELTTFPGMFAPITRDTTATAGPFTLIEMSIIGEPIVGLLTEATALTPGNEAIVPILEIEATALTPGNEAIVPILGIEITTLIDALAHQGTVLARMVPVLTVAGKYTDTNPT